MVNINKESREPVQCEKFFKVELWISKKEHALLSFSGTLQAPVITCCDFNVRRERRSRCWESTDTGKNSIC